jgi:Polyketide cyclase / dehydrase and lipid transport
MMWKNDVNTRSEATVTGRGYVEKGRSISSVLTHTTQSPSIQSTCTDSPYKNDCSTGIIEDQTTQPIINERIKQRRVVIDMSSTKTMPIVQYLHSSYVSNNNTDRTDQTRPFRPPHHQKQPHIHPIRRRSPSTFRLTGVSLLQTSTVMLLMLLQLQLHMVAFVTVLHSSLPAIDAFVIPISSTASTTATMRHNDVHRSPSLSSSPLRLQVQHTGTSAITVTTVATTSTALNVWWYGGDEAAESNNNYNNNQNDSCELVAVRIERTSPNSRRIFGDITIPAPLTDVWSIVTDYNRLSIHVPNLVESKIERTLSGSSTSAGDGQYQCRLYQKGAQKIIGFEFGASVTMDMKEIITMASSAANAYNTRDSNGNSMNNRLPAGATTLNLPPINGPSASALREERKITFKCVDSFFFREFDGDWKVQEHWNYESNSVETLLSYVVEVRPKGPVPVAALEWRIREDVPTNLRAVKNAALLLSNARQSLQKANPMTAMSLASSSSSSYRQPSLSASASSTSINTFNRSVTPPQRTSNTLATQSTTTSPNNTQRLTALARDARTKVQWLQEETMAAYLPRRSNSNSIIAPDLNRQ